jgi:hypothetical protein
MKAYGGVEGVKLHIVLTLALGGWGRGEWSVTCLGHFTSGECGPGIQYMGTGWTPVSVDMVEKRKNLCAAYIIIIIIIMWL